MEPNSEASQMSKTIYHYTGGSALKEIMSGGKIWASDAEFLNDSQEMNFGRDNLLEGLEELASGSGGKSWTGSGVCRGDVVRDAARSLESRLTLVNKDPYAVYVACFCGHGDLLSQWRGYGADGGYAIGFRPEAFTDTRLKTGGLSSSRSNMASQL